MVARRLWEGGRFPYWGNLDVNESKRFVGVVARPIASAPAVVVRCAGAVDGRLTAGRRA
ncbi:hypothetical protein BRAS3843_1570010 [Bradyrhizobium sp. STM 3843]|nr:hypothetical protein BRAS3843_1570010 [Bradyrhizobium sp. STM 3843]